MMRGADGLTVIYIAGMQNSGSTLLEALLCDAPGVQGLGEVAGLHRYRGATICDCGEPAASCGPCRAAVGVLEEDLDRALALHALPVGGRCLHWVVVPMPARRRYAELVGRVLAAVAVESGRRVLVDSSKNVGRLAALLGTGAQDVRVIHLVRDPRGVLQSRIRRAGRLGRRERFATVLARWLGKNVLIGTVLRLRAGRGRFLLVRYEDLMADPPGELDRIGRFAGIDTAGLAERAASTGVARSHLFEPPRGVDYRVVQLEPSRLAEQRLPSKQRLQYWLAGGFASALWGYDLSQSYAVEPGAHR